MKNKDLETENEVKKMKSLSFGRLGEGKKSFCRERYREKWDSNREDPIYRKSQFLDESRGIEN